MRRSRPQRRFLWALVPAVALTAGLAVWLQLNLGGDTVTVWVDDLATLLAIGLATGLCFRASVLHGGELRRFWGLLGLACAAWTAGEAIWDVYDLILVKEVPVPSWADLGYLTAIPLAAAALLAHPAMRRTTARQARSLFDGLVVATALLFLSWTLVLGPLWRSTDLSTMGGVVTLAYPFGDVVIVFLVVLVVRRMTAADRLSLWCLLAGLLALSLTDSSYAYMTEVKSYASGALLDAGWVAGYLGIALGAWSSNGLGAVERGPETDAPRLLPIVAPFLPMLGALAIIGTEIQLGHDPDPVAAGVAFALVLLVLARQSLLMWDLFGPGPDREASLVDRVHSALGSAALAGPGPAAGERTR